MTYRQLLFVSTALAASGCNIADDAPPDGDLPVQGLGTPMWVSPSEFTSIGSVRVMSDGRLVIVDVGTKELFLVTADGARFSQIGRSGDGPGEYRQPQLVLPMPGDSTLVLDAALRRCTVLAPDGTAARTFAYPQTDGSGPSSDAKIDTAGAIYFTSLQIDMASARVGEQTSNRPAILRWHPDSARVDTVATLEAEKMVALPQRISSTGAPFVALVLTPFSPADGWSVSSTGDVTVIRGASFAVERYAGSSPARTLGQIRHTPIPVTSAERAVEQRDALREAIPEFKPPFVAQETRAGANGESWVKRTPTSAADTTTEWNVLDSSGALAARFHTPLDARIKWVSDDLVVLVRTDDDGLQRLEGYRRPI